MSKIKQNIKTLRKLARRLSVYNDWRRGSDRDPMPEPEQIGNDIDAAIQAIEEYVEMLKDAEVEKPITLVRGSTVARYTRATDNK